METPFYQRILKEELAKRSGRNPRYSVRAFAKVLKLDPGTVSRVLCGKQVPGHKMAEKIMDALGMSPEDRPTFLVSVASVKKGQNIKRLSPIFKMISKIGAPQKPQELSVDLYRAISDWYHAVILELPYVEGFKSDPKWIAQELGISVLEAQLAVSRLIELGLLKKQNGKLMNFKGQLTSADKQLTTSAHKKNQRQFLEQAIFSLEHDPIERRNMTRITMAIDPDLMPLAKDMIYKFSRRLCRFLESGKRREVFTLSMALFPNQRKREKSK